MIRLMLEKQNHFLELRIQSWNFLNKRTLFITVKFVTLVLKDNDTTKKT